MSTSVLQKLRVERKSSKVEGILQMSIKDKLYSLLEKI